jgi:hypothetical protein
VYDDYSRRRNDDRGQRMQRSGTVDVRRLWAGGAATALVAVLVAFIALLIARGIVGVPVLAPDEAGVFGDASTVGLYTLAALAALVATGLMNLLLVAVPQPRIFFAAIAGLATVAVALQPFLTGAELASQIATAVVYLVTGAVIIGLLGSVADYAARPGY